MGKLLIRKLSALFLSLLLAGMVGVLTGCEGDDGAPGPPGMDGAPGEDGAPGVPSTTNESCNVCHGVGAIADVAKAHPKLEKPVVSNIVVSRAGDILTVTFRVTADGDPVEGIGSGGPFGTNDSTDSDLLRVYMADIVPAGTPTANLPHATWETDYLELWAEERGIGSGGTITEPTPGNYSFTMGTPITAIGGPDAPEGDLTHTQRVYVRADARDFEGLNRTMGVANFDMPADGANTGVLVQEDAATNTYIGRTVVAPAACTQCHGDPLERAAHGGGYQSPQVCLFCHSPIGSTPENVGTSQAPVYEPIGDVMQDTGFWLANLIHAIHQESPDMTAVDFSEVTYPRHPSDCGVCHFDAGQDLADEWLTPKVETCGTCHNSAAAQTHLTDVAGAFCIGCHNDNLAPSVASAHEVTTLKGDPAHEGNVVSNTQNYTASLELTPPDNEKYYVAGEEILVTVTTSNIPEGFYNVEGGTSIANLYVYGPRANPVPILTPGSTTDPAFDPETMLADQGRTMLAWIEEEDDAGNPIYVPNTDLKVLTDADAFKYQLQAIPDDLAPGTYMVMAYVTTDVADCSAVYRGSTCIDGWVYDTIQIGTASEEPRVSGDCSGCHDPQDWTSFFHRSYFGTDGCIACHDQSGNFANYLSNRVHAVHAASATGDLAGAVWDGSDPEIHAPTFPRNAYACEACHTSGNESYIADPVPVRWGVPCIGCHGDRSGASDHMIQNGSVFRER
jgi:predicted CXXCH cytochrome family protein